MFVLIQSIFHWTPLDSTGFHWIPVDSDWTLSPLDFDWTLKSGLESSQSPVEWTGLDWTWIQWTGHCTSQSGLSLAWLESTGIHLDYMGEGKDLQLLSISFLTTKAVPQVLPLCTLPTPPSVYHGRPNFGPCPRSHQHWMSSNFHPSGHRSHPRMNQLKWYSMTPCLVNQTAQWNS